MDTAMQATRAAVFVSKIGPDSAARFRVLGARVFSAYSKPFEYAYRAAAAQPVLVMELTSDFSMRAVGNSVPLSMFPAARQRRI